MGQTQEFAVKVEARRERGANGCSGPAEPRIQAFDGRRQFIVRASEIRPGDWLRDLGTLRQVESVEVLPSETGSDRIFVARFASMPGIEDLALGIPSAVTVTIWRPT